MGVRKITFKDEQDIIKVLHKWPPNKVLSWENVRELLKQNTKDKTAPVWSRQSLSGNLNILIAFKESKKRLRANQTLNNKSLNSEEYQLKIDNLNYQLIELTTKYELLLLRHTQLVYNTSLMEKGNHLLTDPLPNNTRNQKG